MRTTARFTVNRKKELESVFNESALVSIWRKIVRKQMRSLEILDLHDYYDFNYKIEDRVKSIVKEVLSGRYCESAWNNDPLKGKIGVQN